MSLAELLDVGGCRSQRGSPDPSAGCRQRGDGWSPVLRRAAAQHR